MTDQELLDIMIKELVRNPEEVKINRSTDDRGVLLTVFINPSDAGIIIGRQGTTAQAIRTVLHAYGLKHNSRVSVRLHESSHKFFNKKEVYEGGNRELVK